MAKAQRDAKGRFIKGNSVAKGAGRPPVQYERALLEEFNKRLSPEKFGRLIEKAYELAMRGSESMIKLLIAHGIGKPTQRVEADIRSQHLNIDVATAIEVVYGPDD